MILPSRFAGPPAQLAEGWSMARLTQPSRLSGANGIATGPDGRIWVASVPSSSVNAINPDFGAIETISPMDGAITAPDDLVFDEAGNVYLTEITLGRVAMRDTKGRVSVIQGDMPVANPITYHQGHLIAGECRMDARIMELDRGGGAPRVIKDGIPMANAFQVGPDGRLYAPIMGANEIWAIDLATGAHEVVAGDLGVPDSVKFDAKGRIVTTQVASGQVLRLDVQAGTREVLAQLPPGLDNVTFVGERIFISSINGSITEILEPGKVRPLVERGLQWPLGLAVDEAGTLFVADGVYGYTIAPDAPVNAETLQLAGMIFYPGCPGYMRGVAKGSAPGEWIIATGLGSLARYNPAQATSDFIAHGYDILMGVAVSDRGAIVFSEYGAGRVHVAPGPDIKMIAEGLDKPMGVALIGDTAYVAEAGAGRIVKLQQGSPMDTVVDGLERPEGLCAHDGKLYAVDTKARALIEINPARGTHAVIASQLPVGAPHGVAHMPWLGPIGDMSGPMVNFASVAAGTDGTIYVAADAEGSVLAVRCAH
ncbi:MAG: SMP-30/gluconolactonase/LRE family protein [Alphaproteobacteria bacterium]|nr:SMP-30/gluconolactonase/LRE family protein [Alphaproteobacteria bacterium]MDE2041786.1 SMP-30/gluconolactonase/LRE family protein [Alphaproteobacteria bacterium]MDE2341432.1 SMP-30/gluconolactonase/LRE family protein [Alphaproteobacteria bacterium]